MSYKTINVPVAFQFLLTVHGTVPLAMIVYFFFVVVNRKVARNPDTAECCSVMFSIHVDLLKYHLNCCSCKFGFYAVFDGKCNQRQ